MYIVVDPVLPNALFPLLQVSVLVLKVQSVCVSMEAVGESTTVALEVGQVTPSQLGNVSLRQYLSNRSLGKKKSAYTLYRTLRVSMKHGAFLFELQYAALQLYQAFFSCMISGMDSHFKLYLNITG